MLLLIALVFGLMGFRLGLNNQDSNVIDVGYAGVAGASRLLDGVLPYGHMPDKTAKPCGGKYSNGDPKAYIQPNGRCESPIGQGDTYGPTIYLTYVPAVAIMGWGGMWDSLPAAHVTASAFDLLAITGLFVAGWRLASGRIGLLLAFGWAANPFTLYALNMNTNDALVGALLAWTIAALSVPPLRGALLAAASLTKFAPLALVPLFASLKHRAATAAGFAVTGLVLLSMLALDADGLSLFWHRTLGYQLGRVTPMAIWTLPSYHPGWPDITWLQHVVQFFSVVGLVALAVFPRARKDAAGVAALGAAAVIALQIGASYWFYPYVCWWLPLVLVGLLLPRVAAEPEPEPEPS
jgi:Glycosyltransferase family 87